MRIGEFWRFEIGPSCFGCVGGTGLGPNHFSSYRNLKNCRVDVSCPRRCNFEDMTTLVSVVMVVLNTFVVVVVVKADGTVVVVRWNSTHCHLKEENSFGTHLTSQWRCCKFCLKNSCWCCCWVQSVSTAPGWRQSLRCFGSGNLNMGVPPEKSSNISGFYSKKHFKFRKRSKMTSCK